MNKLASRSNIIWFSVVVIALTCLSCAKGDTQAVSSQGVAGMSAQNIAGNYAPATTNTGAAAATAPICGNGIREVNEDCDGALTVICEDLGFTGGGTLQCFGCLYDTTMCTMATEETDTSALDDGGYGI
jgi:hypothetical protein